MLLTGIKGEKVLVLGLAKSGRAAIALLLKLGASKIIANDAKGITLLPEVTAEFGGFPEVEIVAGEHPESLLSGVTLIIKSPGVSPRLPLLQKARRAGIPVFSEIELAFCCSPVPLAAITGTNGKTTTTALTGAIFKEQGFKTHVAGNIGFPLSEAVRQASAGDIIVAELSSFQLEDTLNFRAPIAAILNLTPDHLDYHETMEQYIAAKTKILFNQESSDWAVLNWDDSCVRALAAKTKGNVLPFSRKESPSPGVYLQDGAIYLDLKTKKNPVPRMVCRENEIKIPGVHNLENALAAVAISAVGGAAVDNMGRALKNFPGVPHRLENVTVIRGVSFINDSKGTNPDAALQALYAVRGSKVLIAGGLHKGGSMRQFMQALIPRGVKKLILIGRAAPLFADLAREAGFSEEATVIVADLETAVAQAFDAAIPGDTVLFSPACASWDMFKNFEERGERFKAAVFSLREALEI